MVWVVLRSLTEGKRGTSVIGASSGDAASLSEGSLGFDVTGVDLIGVSLLGFVVADPFLVGVSSVFSDAFARGSRTVSLALGFGFAVAGCC